MGSEYASGEYRLRESAGMSERVRSGVGAGVVSTSRGDTVADDGCYGEVRVGVAWGAFASAVVEGGAETAHRRRELPVGGFGFGGGAPPRRARHCAV